LRKYSSSSFTISTRSLPFLATTIASSLVVVVVTVSFENPLITERCGVALAVALALATSTGAASDSDSSSDSSSTDLDNDGGPNGSQKSHVEDDAGGGGGGGGGAGDAVTDVHVSELGLIGGGGGGGGGGVCGGWRSWTWWWWWWWRLVSALANWSRAEPVLRSERRYIVCAAEKACLAFTNCFMYFFLALHLDTISSLSILE
jgi:hypothetical protein